jgi:hypothetical protein
MNDIEKPATMRQLAGLVVILKARKLENLKTYTFFFLQRE